jgi:protein O-GlcNAc transferase
VGVFRYMKQQLPEMSRSLDRAEALHREGRYEEAALLCRNVLLQDEDNLEATFLLATIKYAGHHWHEAVALYQKACDLAPRIGFLRINLALALQELDRFDEALSAFDEALKLDDPSVSLHYNRGVLLQRHERLDEARHEFEYALALEPGHVGSWINLSAVYLAIDDTDGAVRCCHHGLHLDHANVALTANLATAYGKAFRFEESLVWHQRLLKLVVPGEQAEVLGRIANCLSDNWMVDEAIACFDHAIEASNDFCQKRSLASTRLFVLHYSSNWLTSAIADEHRAWGRQYFGAAPKRSFLNSRDPSRPIKIAYLSPDLRIHAVVFFLQPVLAAHDPAQVTVYCYSDVKKPDEVTRQLREQHEVVWRDCAGLADAALQELLLQDEIDILLDLAGHTGLNRLPLFAGRVAPVQVSWIGYPNTTGLTDMDYRITDVLADPPGTADQLHTETLIRLPNSFLCYRPGADFPDVGPLPYQTNGYVTFGSFSNFKKVTPDILDCWARILAAVPDSRLVFRARGLSPERFMRDIAPLFLRHQVAPERISVLGHARSVVENLAGYHRIDIALDTFPYHGTTTTCESLCMGVPVVTRAGNSHVSRVGVSLLHSVGLPELIGNSPEEYCSIAVTLAGDTVCLAALRATLRERLLASPLADNSAFTRHLEGVYRQIWQRWCKENSR